MTVNTRVIKLLLAKCDRTYIQLDSGLRLQVIPNLEALPYCAKHQSAAFVASQQILVVWEDDPKKLLDRVNFIQDTLMRMIWENGGAMGLDEKKEPHISVAPAEGGEIEIEEELEEKPRRPVLIQATLTACTIALVMFALGSGWRHIAVELVVDQNWVRIVFISCMLPQAWLSLVGHNPKLRFQTSADNCSSSSKPLLETLLNSLVPSGKWDRILSTTQARHPAAFPAIIQGAFRTSQFRCLSTKRVCMPS